MANLRLGKLLYMNKQLVENAEEKAIKCLELVMDDTTIGYKAYFEVVSSDPARLYLL